MVLRALQILLALGNCGYGLLLLGKYGNTAMQIHSWPLTMNQEVILLIGISVMPAALVGLRWPVIAGIFEFACAFIGLQLVHDESLAHLKYFAHISMFVAAGVLVVAVLRGITEVTHEAFHKPEVKEKRRKAHAHHPQHHHPGEGHARPQHGTHTIHPRHNHATHPKPHSKTNNKPQARG
jgi:hypothetical protein